VNLLQQGLNFYRLMVVWLAGLVGGFHLPLPSICPMEFASMPEHFVEDPMDLLIFASRIPKGLDTVNLVIFQTYSAHVCQNFHVCQSLCVTLDACHGTSVLNMVA
jgi:ubiquitin conjugation factor E4 B